MPSQDRKEGYVKSLTRDVCWRLHLTALPDDVYYMLATDEGRARFWAESAEEEGGVIAFKFPNGEGWEGRVLEAIVPHRFAVDYFGSKATFELDRCGSGGTDVSLVHAQIPIEDHVEVLAGWVSVLLALKAAVDFGADLRNHDPTRTWSEGYVDN